MVDNDRASGCAFAAIVRQTRFPDAEPGNAPQPENLDRVAAQYSGRCPGSRDVGRRRDLRFRRSGSNWMPAAATGTGSCQNSRERYKKINEKLWVPGMRQPLKRQV